MAPKVMKPPSDWDENDTQTGGDWYDGPLPDTGVYKGIVKKIFQHKVKGGEHDGEIRFHVICEIVEGVGGTKFKGAGVTKWLQLTTQGRPWLHQFLHSLTDGTEDRCKAIRHAWKTVGWTLDDPDSKGRSELIKIGKKTDPRGLPCTFFVQKRVPQGQTEERAEISRFITRFSNTEDADADPGDDNMSPEDAFDNMADDDATATADDDADGDSAEADGGDDDSGDDGTTTATADDGDDDPWSV